MGKTCSSWYYQQRLWGQSVDIDTLTLPTDFGPQNASSMVDGPCIGTTGLSMPNSVGYTMLPPSYYQHHSSFKSVLGVPVPLQLDTTLQFGEIDPGKNFIIFDRSGNRTSLYFTTMAQHFATHKSDGLLKPTSKNENLNLPALEEKSSWCELDQDVISSMKKSEMREDTEELDALLYSDENMDEEEEASTGHSPPLCDSEKVGCDSNEIVNSSPTKRKRANDEYSGSSLIDTADSGKYEGFMRNDNVNSDAFNCAEPRISVSFGSNKRSKKDKIRQTIDILRNIVPGSKDKDVAVVLDEAVQYLKSLKFKAIALGLGNLA